MLHRALAPSRALIAVAGAVTIVACGSSDPGATPTPEGATPTPFVEIDLELADRLLAQGDDEDALAIYTAAAERGTGDERRESLWAIATAQSQAGNHSEAEVAIEDLQDDGVEPGKEGAALLLQGKAEYAQGDFKEATEAFEAYIENDGPAKPYATLHLSQIARQQGDLAEAVALLEEALASDLPPAVATESLFSLATLQEEAGRPADAIATLQRAADAALSFTDQAEALWLIAEIANRTGDAATAESALQSLVAGFPASGRSLQALDLPVAERIESSGRALVLFHNRVNDQAAVAYQEIVAASGDGTNVEAQYRLGILAERFEQWDDAIAHYDAAINASLSPGQSPFYAAQATWDKATVLERLGRIDEAIVAYASIAALMPAHEQAGPGVFRAGLMSYQLARPGDALSYWNTFLQVAPTAEEKARANFWLGKTSDALGDPSAALVYYETAIAADPLDFHAMRARAIVAENTSARDGEPLTASDANWAATEDWMTEVHGAEDTVATEAILSGEHFARANELLTAGLGDRADLEFRALLADHEGDAWITYRVVRELDSLGRYWVSSVWARDLIREDSPPALFQLVYPLPYFDLVDEEATKNGIPPLLFLALIRQESLYQRDAVSSADAMGLTQVIPSTADGIAADLGAEDFRYTDLLRPRISLEFGAHYLGGVLEGFGGVIPVALSAYNGGPGNASRWWEASVGDEDLFVETIDYEETRSYVELVMENYALYQFAYGLADEPVLAVD